MLLLRLLDDAFIALSDDGRPLGQAEVSVRSDYVNGTETSPVAFLEGPYVIPAAGRSGVADLSEGGVGDMCTR